MFFLWPVSLLLTGWFAFEVCHRLATPVAGGARLATFEGKAIERQDVDAYYPAFRARIAGELVLAQLAARACGYSRMGHPSSQVYIRKLLAAEWPEQRLRSFYNLFREELTRYELAGDKGCRDYGLVELEEQFGRQVAERICALRLHQEIEVAPRTRLRLVGKRCQFEELKPELVERIFAARRIPVAYQLLSGAHFMVLGPLGNDLQVLDFSL
ncbi:hypothetical protein JST97_21675 [bacterium]|nr:hypothetical protein [bacterium]